MIHAAFFDIFGISVFIFLLIIGLKFSKYRIKFIKYSGYILFIIGILGLIIDTYNVMHEIIIPAIKV